MTLVPNTVWGNLYFIFNVNNEDKLYTPGLVAYRQQLSFHIYLYNDINGHFTLIFRTILPLRYPTGVLPSIMLPVTTRSFASGSNLLQGIHTTDANPQYSVQLWTFNRIDSYFFVRILGYCKHSPSKRIGSGRPVTLNFESS